MAKEVQKSRKEKVWLNPVATGASHRKQLLAGSALNLCFRLCFPKPGATLNPSRSQVLKSSNVTAYNEESDYDQRKCFPGIYNRG